MLLVPLRPSRFLGIRDPSASGCRHITSGSRTVRCRYRAVSSNQTLKCRNCIVQVLYFLLGTITLGTELVQDIAEIAHESPFVTALIVNCGRDRWLAAIRRCRRSRCSGTVLGSGTRRPGRFDLTYIDNPFID